MSEQLTQLKNAAIEAESTVEGYKAEIAALESAETVDKEAVKAKKAELRKAESALKKANAAIVKEEGKAEKEAEKAAKEAEKAAKEAEKATKEAEKEAKAKAREEAKAAKAAEREANRMPKQNGIRRPKPDTKCGRAWTIADELSAKFGQPTPIKDLLEAAEAEGMNAGNVKAEYARWRKYYGITGRVTLPKAEAAAE